MKSISMMILMLFNVHAYYNCCYVHFSFVTVQKLVAVFFYPRGLLVKRSVKSLQAISRFISCIDLLFFNKKN